MNATTHPALYDQGIRGEHDRSPHFVPEGWEDIDRGLCPCGEVVRWSPSNERWVPDRELVVLILSPGEVASLRGERKLTTEHMARLESQLAAQEREPDDGNVLIAGVLYDRETGWESETP